MARKHRFAPPDCNLHITQRGNYGQETFLSAYDSQFFLDLIAKYAATHFVDILAYCLMPNHFHLIVHGHQSDCVSRFMQTVNSQYAQAMHNRLSKKGRFWQDRFYCCILDNAHLVAALQYVELNPVRARMVSCATRYPWSTAAIHTGRIPPPPWIQMSTFGELFTPNEWEERLVEGQSVTEQIAIRNASKRQNAIVGSADFIRGLEIEGQRTLTPRPRGRPLLQRAAGV